MNWTGKRGLAYFHSHRRSWKKPTGRKSRSSVACLCERNDDAGKSSRYRSFDRSFGTRSGILESGFFSCWFLWWALQWIGFCWFLKEKLLIRFRLKLSKKRYFSGKCYWRLIGTIKPHKFYTYNLWLLCSCLAVEDYTNTTLQSINFKALNIFCSVYIILLTLYLLLEVFSNFTVKSN